MYSQMLGCVICMMRVARVLSHFGPPEHMSKLQYNFARVLSTAFLIKRPISAAYFVTEQTEVLQQEGFIFHYSKHDEYI